MSRRTVTGMRQVAMVLFAIVVTTAALKATERRPLPPFVVTAFDGQAINGPDLAQEGNWLLIYVQPSCGSCIGVLQAMTRDEHPGLAARVTIVIVGATDAQAQSIVGAATEMAEARWLIDRDRSAGRALKVAALPVVFGVRDGTIEWGLAGVFRKSAEMKSVLVSWLTQPRP